ncbi:hypothetical protein CRYUN_Cryun09bG0079300 [Craigia yunnanensis]
MGSSRSGFLGEATINLASYISSKSSIPLSLPLKKCNHGTVLQVKIQCLTQRENLRDEQWKDTDSYLEDASLEYDDLENNSDLMFLMTGRQLKHFLLIAAALSFVRLMKPSHVCRKLVSQHQTHVIALTPWRVPLTGKITPLMMGEDLNRVSRLVPSSPLRHAGSSKDHLEAAEITIWELWAEARMWEQNARKLMIDLENLQKEFFDQSKHQKNLEVALSTSQAECDCLKREVEQREENAKLALQLKKTQESNIELVSILQELEVTIEKQKVEIDNFSSTKSEFEELGKDDFGFKGSRELNASKQVPPKQTRKSSDSDGVSNIVEHQRRDLHAENRNLELQFQLLQESHRNLESTIQFLEKTLEGKNREMEIEQGLRSGSLMDCESEWKGKLAEKEEKIFNLEIKLSKALNVQVLKEMGSEKEGNCNLIKEIEALKLKVQELERDCNKLTDENLELLFKLKESSKDHSATSNSLFPDHPGKNSLSRNEQEVTSCEYEDELNRKPLTEVPSADHLQIQSVVHGNRCADLELQLEAFKDKASYLDGELSKGRARAETQENEIVALQQQLKHYQQTEIESKDQPVLAFTESRISESPAAVEISKLLAELNEQIQLSLADLRRQYALNSHAIPEGTCRSDVLEILKSEDLISQKHQVEIILNNCVQLKQLFRERSSVGDKEYNKEATGSAVSADDILDKLEDYKLKELSSPCKEAADLRRELSEKISEIEKLKSDNLL